MANYLERLNLKVNDPIPGLIEPDTVVEVIDNHGRIVVGRETGNIHAWWGRWINDPTDPERKRKKKVLTHHGGKFGWNDIQKPIDQHNRVLEQYLGYEIKVDEVRAEVPIKPRSLSEIAVAIRTQPDIVEIQGRQAWSGEAVHQIGRATRRLVAYPIVNATEANFRNAPLLELQSRLESSNNPILQSGGRNLAQAFNEEGEMSMRALVRASDDLLSYLVEINDIVIGTFGRLASLERKRWVDEDAVMDADKTIAAARTDWDSSVDDSMRSTVISRVNGQLFGGTYHLATLKMQPFKREVEELFRLSGVDHLNDKWISGDYGTISTSLRKAGDRLHSWGLRIKTRRQPAKQPSLV